MRVTSSHPMYLFALLVSCGGGLPPATPVSGSDGAWSNPTTWGGKTPDANSAVTIPAGKTVTLDSSVAVRSLTVNGALQWADVDNLEVKANWIMVESGGAFRIGSPAQPFLKRATVTLTGNDQAENIMGMGTKCLCAMGGGALAVYGENRPSWTKLSASVNPGSSRVTLFEAGGWRAGEKIVIASSSLNPDEAEVRGIVTVSADGKTLTLDAGLSYAHFGQMQMVDGKSLDERAEVGLLSRNIVIQGDTSSDASKFGGHVMVMNNGSEAQIRGVEFRRMGQFNHLGRYPLHFHQMRDATGSFVAASSVHDSLQRGIVVHGSDNLRVERNVVFNTVGHGYVLEDGSERGTVFDGNLGLLPRAATFTVDGLKDQNDRAAANFWFRTAAATVTGNASAGGAFAGYWFDMGFVDGNNASKALLRFQNNTVHSHSDGRVPDTESTTWAVWQTDGYVPSQEGVLHFEGLTAYKNARAIETAGRGLVTDSMLADNGKAISQLLLKDSTVVSRSANTDTHPDWGATGMFAYGGFANAENVTWVGFKDGRTVSSTLTCGIEYPRFSAKGSKLMDSDPAAGCGDIIQNDIDGSLSQQAGTRKLVSLGNTFGLVSKECLKNSAAGVAICPDYDYRTLNVTYPTGAGFANPDWHVDVVRDEDGDRVTPNHFRWVSYVIPGKTYRLETRNSRSATDTAVYPVSKLEYLQLGLSVGELAEATPPIGGRNTVYDPAWTTRSVSVSAPLPVGGYRVRFCKFGSSCKADPVKWEPLSATVSLAALNAQATSGFVADGTGLHFKFFGGDEMRFERL